MRTPASVGVLLWRGDDDVELAEDMLIDNLGALFAGNCADAFVPGPRWNRCIIFGRPRVDYYSGSDSHAALERRVATEIHIYNTRSRQQALH